MKIFSTKIIIAGALCCAAYATAQAQPATVDKVKHTSTATDRIRVNRTDQPVVIKSRFHVVDRSKLGTPATTNPGTGTTTTDPPKEDKPAVVEPSKERKGPSNLTFNLTSQVHADKEFGSKDIVNVFNTVYRDGNSNS